MARRINQAGLDLIKSFEGLRLKAYQDSVKIWTIGYGHTGSDVSPGLEISADQAEDLLRNDLGTAEHGVDDATEGLGNDNQFAACVSLAFNVGVHAFKGSTLARMIREGHAAQAGDQFLKWNKAGGQVVKGLTRRREAERRLFLTPDPSDKSHADVQPLPVDPPEPDEPCDTPPPIAIIPATTQQPVVSLPTDTPIQVTAVEPQKSNAKKSIWATIAAAAGWVALNIQNFFGKAYESVQNNPMLTVSLVAGTIALLVIYWKYQERLERLDARRGEQAHELTLEQMRLAADPARYPVKIVKPPQ